MGELACETRETQCARFDLSLKRLNGLALRVEAQAFSVLNRPGAGRIVV
jgi:hypothetical protein